MASKLVPQTFPIQPQVTTIQVTATQEQQNIQTNTTGNNNDWGKTQQTTRPTTGNTIPEGELISAINIYRQAHGLSTLSINESLCQETRKRVQNMVSLNSNAKSDEQIVINHDVMAQDVQNGTLSQLTGKHFFGENIAYAWCKGPDGSVVAITTGTQLVEWCFDLSPSHREELLRPDYTDVCSSGQFPFYVETFAK